MAIHVVAVEQRNETFLMGPLLAQGPRHATCLHLMSLPRETVVEDADGGQEVFFYCRSGLKKTMFDVVYGCSKLVHPRDQQEFIHSVPKIVHEGGKKSKKPSEKRWKNWFQPLFCGRGKVAS